MGLTYKSALLFFFLTSSIGTASAQFTKSMTLKPIYKEGWKHFYDTKKVNSAYSLQIPLEAINDRAVNRYFTNFKTFQNLRGLAYIPSLVFLFTNSGSSQQDADTFLYLVLAGLAGDITFNILSQNQMRKAIDIYNVSIAQKGSLGLQLERTKNNQTLISFAVRQRF